jgi:hypothetical protein
MKAYGGVDVWMYFFLTSATFQPLYPPPGKKSRGTLLIEGWVDPTASLGDVEKRKFFTLPGLELRTSESGARNSDH